ncbi:nucleoside phosphorylase domain-containing protein [Hypoxylon rubiginosum]|uniref:Nucleoside phosphorylase domain-containing protein n=1 Tax=Hypoxylon rubiginosum TaxID=110542 RepID=A0ACC0CKU0_9PEZI|nr:nucleoside phosphorylase domain-containing protein [Hypoxylon rubiginosum]
MPNLRDYTVGWICAIQPELVAARAFLDEKYDIPDDIPVDDNNVYILGRIGKHKVIIASLPRWLNTSASAVIRDMVRSFPNVRIVLMVGVGGGAPSQKHDIRLGDVVVGFAGDGNGGVFQYNYGTIQGKTFTTTGHLNQSPQAMLTALTALGAQYKGDSYRVQAMINDVLEKHPRLRKGYCRPTTNTDKLYKSTSVHKGGDKESCESICGNAESDLVFRSERVGDKDSPAIHYGLIVSANQLMKDALIRDRLAAEKDVLCFETEAAGLMNHFPCLVIRGICGYSDTHKNMLWQGYAAVAAAAYAKHLLSTITPNEVEAERKLSQILFHINQVIKWLLPPDPSTDLNIALERRNPRSGQWLLRHTSYSTWKTERNSFLWLHGIPGCGKTILSSTVVEDLQHTHPDNHLYFYFDFNDSYKQHLVNAIRSLIIQLYYQREDVRKQLDSLHSSCGDGGQQPSLESLCMTFQNMVEQAGEVWIVLDALDECSTRNEHRAELLRWIESLRGLQMNIHLLVTSRIEQDIKTSIENCSRSQDIIPIQSALIEEDIRTYIHARVQEHQGLKRWQSRPDIQSEIETALLEKADGMFRWVSRHLDDLEWCISPHELREMLQGDFYGAALQDASFAGHMKIIQMYLDRGTDVNARGGLYGNALQAASSNGHEKVVQILLDRGADVNAQGGRYGNALQAASWWGHEKVVKILLNQGADVNARGGLRANALQAALSNGRKNIVLLLLVHGAVTEEEES